MYTKENFREELNMIVNPIIREFTEHCLDKAPAYFWRISSSSGGNHHPEKSNGVGGLIRHTKSAVYLGSKLVDVYNISEKRDIVISALILHDIIKRGLPERPHTVKTHDVDGFNFCLDCADAYTMQKQEADPSFMMPMIETHDILDCIRSHMGRWGTPISGFDIKFIDLTPIEQIVHLADVISSCRQVDILTVKA